MTEIFDYLVVGAGSAGCIVAAELSKNATVLVLEAGQRAEENPETLRADGYKTAFVNDRLMYDRFSVPQRECGNRPLFAGTGRGVGGSGSVNAMVYTRGDARDFAQWKVDGWTWEDVRPHFEALERRLDVRRSPPTQFTEACIHAAEQAGFSRKEDLNDGTLRGHLGYEWMNRVGEDRRSSYVAFLRGEKPNLTVRTEAVVSKIHFDSNRRAHEVEFSWQGQIRRAQVRREVVLCAGALETPKLLMLSGIGPREELARHEIPVVVDAQGVGRNLQDHPNVTLFFEGKREPDCTFPQLYGFHRALETTALPKDQADTCYVFYTGRSSFREAAMRMLPGIALPQSMYKIGAMKRGLRGLVGAALSLSPLEKLVGRMYGIVVILGKAASRGRLTLASRDVRVPAATDPNYLSDPEDLATLMAGVRLARKIAVQGPLVDWGNKALMPSASMEGKELEHWVRNNVMTTYHFGGTCRMGSEDTAPVDARLRLRGVQNVRVADASVMPVLPVSALNAPSMLIGLRASLFIAEDATAHAPPSAVEPHAQPASVSFLGEGSLQSVLTRVASESS